MKIFIVEDDPFKLSQLSREAEQYGDIGCSSSLQEAILHLSSNSYDFVLLDMAIPSHAGEAGSTDIYSQPVGGLDILLELATDGREERIVILTQYPTIEYNREHVPLHKMRDKLLVDDVSNVVGVVLFDDEGAWRGTLRAYLETFS